MTHRNTREYKYKLSSDLQCRITATTSICQPTTPGRFTYVAG